VTCEADDRCHVLMPLYNMLAGRKPRGFHIMTLIL
jgi:hypothetical protein